MKRFKLILSIIISSLILGLVIIWRTLLVNLPHPDQLYSYASAPSTNIYDRHGTLLYQITDPHQGYHTPLTLDKIPAYCAQATIATEDATFYQNPGFDTRAMLRALISNLRQGGVVSGASTITQQLARNLMFTEAERTEISISRKLREIILAWRITNRYNKDEILTLYLNETYYGNLAYGIEAASATYFGKAAAELDLAECALLVGLPQSPVYYNPLENLPAAKTRQHDVLRLMVKNDYISSDEAKLAEDEKLQFAAIPFPIEAPHFVMYVRGQLERQFGLEAIYTQGLQVHTTLDLDIHNETQRIIRYHLGELSTPRDNFPPRNVRNAAVVVLQPQTGAILAMVGSPDYFDPRIDGNVNATVALRQPGSSIKPITYAAAFDPEIAQAHGYQPLTPATVMMDVRTSFTTKEGQPYVPQNYDRTWHGPVLLREGLATSLNLIAVKVMDYVGVETMTQLARQLGITTFNDPDRYGLAMTLGGGEVRLLELSGAYAAFINQGRKTEPFAIERVTNAQGDLLYKRVLEPGEQVLDSRTAYLITNILSDNKARAGAFGEGSSLYLRRPAAAKTGTTTDFRDNWTIGYTPDYLTGVWVGNADNEPMRFMSGVTGAAPIWNSVMQTLHQDQQARPFIQPPGLVAETVCAINGMRPSEGCQRTIDEIFIQGTEPQYVDTWHQKLKIDRRTGLLAGPGCPAEFVRERWFVVYPAEAEQWVQRNQTRQAPDFYSPLCNDGPEGVQATVRDFKVNPAWNQSTAGNVMNLGQTPLVDAEPIRFLSPDQGTTYRLSQAIPLDKQKIRVAVQLGAEVDPDSVRLYRNQELMTDETETLWQMSPGQHRFEAIGLDSHGDEVQAVVEIEVK